jgi:hypothetical protein
MNTLIFSPGSKPTWLLRWVCVTWSSLNIIVPQAPYNVIIRINGNIMRQFDTISTITQNSMLTQVRFR